MKLSDFFTHNNKTFSDFLQLLEVQDHKTNYKRDI